MEKILLEEFPFDYHLERHSFDSLFSYLHLAMGSGAFVKYRGDTPIGALAPAYYEAVTMGTLSVLDRLDASHYDEVRQTVIDLVQ